MATTRDGIWARMRRLPLAAALCAGCAAEAPPATAPPRPPPPAPPAVVPGGPAASPARSGGARAAGAEARETSPAARPGAGDADAGDAGAGGPNGGGADARFPPPPFPPLHERTAQPGDGVWTPMPEGAAGGPAVMYRATAHPHRIKGFAHVALVAIDLGRVDVRLVAGTLEPASKAVPPERRTGLIPAADQADLIAVFNGGFMARHGRYGVKIEGDTFLPPREDACTVALYRDGAIRIRTWPALQPTEPEMVAYRQAPPCILEQGAQHPGLASDRRPRKWGAAEDGKDEIRRSALGLDATGRVLLFGLGEWVTVKALADAMQAAGAADAAQLDINWSYTRFLLFGRPAPGDPLQVVSTLIPKIKHTSQGYVANPSERDFFYLKRAHTAPAP